MLSCGPLGQWPAPAGSEDSTSLWAKAPAPLKTRPKTERPQVEVCSREELRAWLSQHHGDADSVWLVTWKKGTAHYLPRAECVEELLCWGWIDSTPKKVDDTRTAILVAPRKPKSAWSKVNKQHVAAARRSGAMTEAGEAAIAVAKDNGMWSFLDRVERLEVPPDLAEALGKLRERWDAYPASVRRGTLEWIETAKTEATRAKRIAGTADNAAAGKRPPPYER